MSKLFSVFLILFAGLLAIFLQGTLLRTFLPDSLIPNLFISIVVFLAFYENTPFGALLAFILGVESDLYGGAQVLVGPSAAGLVLVFGVLASLSQRVYVESVFAIFVMSAVSTVVYSLVYSILIFEFNDTAARYFTLSFSNALVTGLLTPVIFKLLSNVRKMKGGASHGAHSMSSRQSSYRAKNV